MPEISEQELNELFSLANTELKETERIDSSISVVALNELRNGSEHRVRAQNADSEKEKLSELLKAKSHFIRAAYDALESRILFSLDRFNRFQENFAKFAEKEDLPVFLDAVKTANEIQKYLVDGSKRSELPDFAELKAKALHLDSQLEKLSENKVLLINSIEKSKKRSKNIIASSIAGLSMSLVSAFLSFYFFQGDTSKDVSAQIKNLSGIQTSLSELQSYVTNQKDLLQNLNKDISSLRVEKAELEQVVALENSKIELVFKQYEKTQQRRRWLDILISFFIGVFSSTTVTLIFKYLRKSSKAPSIDMIVNTKGESI